MRQAHQLDSSETVIISAIKPATLDALLGKAGAVLGHKKHHKHKRSKIESYKQPDNSLCFMCLLWLKCVEAIWGFVHDSRTPFSQARDKLLAYAMPTHGVSTADPLSHQVRCPGPSYNAPAPVQLTSSFNENYKLGDVVGRSIVAPRDLTARDQAETERLKAAARESTRPVFN